MFERLVRSQSKSQPEIVKPGREGDKKRTEALEEQVKILSSTASEAVDRASELEEEVRHLRQITRSGSLQSSLSSFSHSTDGSRLKSSGSMNSLFSTLSTDTAATAEFEDDIYRKNSVSGVTSDLEVERQRRILAERKVEELSKSLSKETNSRIQLEVKYKALEESAERPDESQEKRLHTLEVALKAILNARKELNSIRHYKYV
ncbi:hypothetical protein AWJ20_4326 [Sugiyamaella lignohabitans]|uniref:Uncharacterized protein n=1 Tax=Sugiyamaella lignohabitans TaxID=796027 RepID=A0A167CCJ4_9ASCO|nr:uncharacterized protein AWJ20_4326 [Sugiyamaella lignohabitans]ANB11509.1 hypothetical protein AWJ20_4326 [Sugiyamaella lignohabitans]